MSPSDQPEPSDAPKLLRPLLAQARELVRGAMRPGMVAVDATVGNGHDAQFLAELCGTGGRVFGFEIQAAALAETRRRLECAGRLNRVTLMEQGHERIADWRPVIQASGSVRAVMFNLGYLPGGDRSIVTRATTTLPALDAAFELLHPAGVLTIVAYRRHPGGAEECHAVRAWAEGLVPRRAQVMWVEFPNPVNPSPVLIAVTPGSP